MTNFKGRKLRRLLIVTECEHFRTSQGVVAPRHFVREIDLWARMFEEVVLMTRFPPQTLPKDAQGYLAHNILFITGNSAFSRNFADRVASLGRSMVTLARMIRELARADAVHIRCPSRNGMFALILQHFARRPSYIKWAGAWRIGRPAPLTSYLQKKLVLSIPQPSVVTVYDREHSDPAWINQVNTTSLTREEVRDALAFPVSFYPEKTIHVLWVGRFSKNKNVEMLFRIMKDLKRDSAGSDVVMDLAGDGELRVRLQAEAVRSGLQNDVVFHGRLSWEKLCELYAKAYILVLPSKTEGFPKVAHEAMLFGTPVVAFSVGALPRILEGRGLSVDPSSGEKGLKEAVQCLLKDDTLRKNMSMRARKWASGFSIEDVVARYRMLCEDAWKAQLKPASNGPDRGKS